MKETELFDAMSYIDDSIVDRCIKEKPSRADLRKAAFRRRAAISITAVAAAVAVEFCLISFLHIGGEKPILPVPDHTELLTEAPTPESTQETLPKPTEAPTPEPGLAPIEEYPLPEDPEAVGDCIRDAELIAFLPYGEDENSLGFIPSHPGYEDDTFPNAFAVNDGKAYIADCVNSRIAVCGNGNVSAISFSDPEAMGYYTTMAVYENRIYACCTQVVTDEIDVYDLSGALLESIPVPTRAKQNYGVYSLFVSGGRLWMYDHQLAVYELKDGRFVESGEIKMEPIGVPDPKITFGGISTKLNTGENTIVGLNRILGDRIYCTVYDNNTEGGGLEISYRVYNSEGELLGATVVDGRNVRAYPDSPVFISEEGEVYVMCCMNDGVYITKPHLRTSYTEAPTPEPTEQPELVPEGYDPHDYLALARLLGTQISELGGATLGELSYRDLEGGFSLKDPSTWNDYPWPSIEWSSGKAQKISFYPSWHRIPAALELIGFEELNDVELWYVTFDSIRIEDCPKLDDGCMVYVGCAEGEASIKAGYVEKLDMGSHTHVHCELVSDEGVPFTIDLKAEGRGRVHASTAFYEGEYHVRASAIADEYIDFIGWYDDNGVLVSEEAPIPFSGGELGKISGSISLTARFAAPDAPEPIPEGDYYCEVKPGVASHIDIDGDGKPDTVLVTVNSDELGGCCIMARIELAAEPGDPYVFDLGNEGGDVIAAAVDFDPSDPQKELMVCYDVCDGDPITYVIRVKNDGSGFDTFCDAIEVPLSGYSWYYHGQPTDFVFRAEEGLPFGIRTEVLGTFFVRGRFTVTAEGIEYLNDEFSYGDDFGSPPDFENFIWLKLKKALKVELENGKTVTVPAGRKVMPYSTDRKTYAKVWLEDGRIGRVEVTFGSTEYHYPVFLNGIRQDEYAEMPYAD